jgi:hypothetical protein
MNFSTANGSVGTDREHSKAVFVFLIDSWWWVVDFLYYRFWIPFTSSSVPSGMPQVPAAITETKLQNNTHIRITKPLPHSFPIRVFATFDLANGRSQ